MLICLKCLKSRRKHKEQDYDGGIIAVAVVVVAVVGLRVVGAWGRWKDDLGDNFVDFISNKGRHLRRNGDDWGKIGWKNRIDHNY